jgi:predicted RNA-binding protein YlxR (DUF448 family)
MKEAMVRIAAQRAGEVIVDFDARVEGRGGYLHPRRECFERLVSSRVKTFRSLGRGLERGERITIVEAICRRLSSESVVKLK